MKNKIFLITLAGCAVGPHYIPPEPNVSDSWSSSQTHQHINQEAPLTEWWKIFEDELLNNYIARAAEYNHEVLTAESHILQARALRQVAASSFFPHIGADVNATKTYFSKNGPLFQGGPSVGELPGTLSPTTGLTFTPQTPQLQTLYNALFDASWEIDLFGKTRRTVEAADAVIGQAIEQRNDILLTVMAEVARNYMELRSFQKQSELIYENIQILEKKAALIQKQYDTGYVSRLNYEMIKAAVASEKARLPDIEAQIYRAAYVISVLTGDVPETLVKELLTPRSLPPLPEIVSIGLRSDLLRRRPDVRIVERELAAATAHIGIAVASFFPTITLLADGGFQSLMIKNLFSIGSKTWALGGDVLMPIFEGGRLLGNLKAARAETAATAHRYQQTVLSALEETESSLMSYTQDLSALRDQKESTYHYHHLVFLSQEKESKGIISRLELLDTLLQLHSSELSLLERNTAALIDLITLYKALGGGWEISTL